jgi:hypothetical protein
MPFSGSPCGDLEETAPLAAGAAHRDDFAHADYVPPGCADSLRAVQQKRLQKSDCVNRYFKTL